MWDREILFQRKTISLAKSLSGWSPSINHAGLSLMTRNHMVGKRPPPSFHLPPHVHQSNYFLKLYLNTILTPIHVQINIYIKYIHKTYKVHSQIPELYGFFYRLPTWNNKAPNSPTDDHAHGFYYWSGIIVTETLSRMHGLYSEANERQAFVSKCLTDQGGLCGGKI